MTAIKIIVFVFTSLFKLLLLLLEAPFWCLFVLKQFLFKSYDVGKAATTVKGGTLTCPQGHPLETEGTYECEACGYKYQGSIWACQNAECPQPITPYINCPTCGLSVRNPFRWGRP